MAKGRVKLQLFKFTVCCLVGFACIYYPQQVTNAVGGVANFISAWLTEYMINAVNQISFV